MILINKKNQQVIQKINLNQKIKKFIYKLSKIFLIFNNKINKFRIQGNWKKIFKLIKVENSENIEE